MRILVTRPQPEAARTAAHLLGLGHSTVVDPMLRIEPLTPLPPAGPFDAVAVTSPAAARRLPHVGFAEKLVGVRIYTVGRRTAEVARASGFAQVAAADGDAPALAELLVASLPEFGRVLWIAGEDRAGDLATLLAPHNIQVTLSVVYRAAAVAQMAPPTVEELRAGSIDAALHYSQRTVVNLLAAAERAGVRDRLLPLRHYAMSKQVAEPLVALGAQVVVAPRPDEQSLLDCLAQGPSGA